MNLLNRAISILSGILLSTTSYSQNDSCHLKISLLTCSPGEELYSVFGHSALRVIDQTAKTDIIFNYGTFDFDDPDFYIKFVKGKLLYYVSVENFSDFQYSYNLENRSIIEQELKLPCAEKEKLFEAFRINSLEQNKYYPYHFFFDNCSTRLRDIVAKNTEDSVSFKLFIENPPPSFRDMIHVYLEKGGHYWSEFGIDLLLASRIDRKVINEEAMFLPDYLLKGFDSAVIRQSPLVKSKKLILPLAHKVGAEEKTSLFTPLAVTTMLLLIGIIFSFIRAKWAQNFLDIFDIGYFLILGFIGCFILFMWFGTSHDLCADNYNLLWAIPSHLFIAFFILKKKPFIRKYFAFSAIICLVVTVAWSFIPQGMNSAFLPLVLLSGIRSAGRALKK